ncbi:uncharacterized protein BCR38DRAFT_432118 [Pseudomassariella vexata]|uniref:DUF7735 domain-containing protein n=1 Tax=Pseudomassariella vexata TaxID=1141098 RepID=A0A1Y2E139_9PEZI|nr:uncharacterized protein BCR38DRAFT_432118 [Pseudomassariella vexata]ORY65199.1 hypothetical protein BCR38DRAFT_432118 [Pseudomassariella vexata]
MNRIGGALLLVPMLAARASAWDSTVHTIVAPTAPPMVTSEPWRCLTENATQYFQVPLPTGSLSAAIDSCADEVMKPCLSTVEPAQRFYGCFPEKEKWCGFTTAAPSAVLSDWSSLGSAASVWWEAHSSAAVSLAQRCPLRWYDASLGVLGGSTLLNETIIFAACHIDAQTTGGTSTASAARPDPTPGSGSTAPTPTVNGILGRSEAPEMWMIASTTFAAAAMSAML